MIWIVDDNEDLVFAFKVILKSRGYEVRGVSSAEQALVELEDCAPPDLMLLDYSMPGMNGEEFLTALKVQSPEIFLKTKIVGFSSFSEEDANITHFKTLVSAFTQKPYDIEELVAIVSRFIALPKQAPSTPD